MVEFDTDFPRISDEHLKTFVIDVFTSYGMRQWDAEISAEILVESDLRGIDSHGVPRMAFYVERLKRGGFNLEAELDVVNETAAAVRFDANNGLARRWRTGRWSVVSRRPKRPEFAWRRSATPTTTASPAITRRWRWSIPVWPAYR